MLRNLAINLLASPRIRKGDVVDFIIETQNLADAYDATNLLNTAQETSMKQTREIFDLVKEMRKLNKGDSNG